MPTPTEESLAAAFAAEGEELLRGSVRIQFLFTHATGLSAYHRCDFPAEGSRFSIGRLRFRLRVRLRFTLGR